MTPVDDLAAWLTQVWDEQEKAAIKAGGDVWTLDGGIYRAHPTDEVVDWVYDEADEHIALNDPASVLARIAADRQILARCQQVIDSAYRSDEDDFSDYKMAEEIVRLLAQPYDEREGFRPEWKVS